MKEFQSEDGKEVNLEKLKVEWVPAEKYSIVHQLTAIPCHDVIIEYSGALLLVTRANHPDKGELSMIGGRIMRGKPILESLKLKAKEECNLDIYDIEEMGTARTMFQSDPFGHGKGTDTVNIMFLAKGKGEIKLDDQLSKPVLVKPEEYTEEFREKLRPYTKYMMDLAVEKVNSSQTS